MVDDAAEALRKSVIDDLNPSPRWGELLHTLSSNLRTRLEQIAAIKSGLSRNTKPSNGAPESQSFSRDQYLSESSMDPSFGASQQSIDTAAPSLGNPGIFNTDDVFNIGTNQVNMDVSGCTSNWDDLSLWLDPLGPISATNISQMPWHGDQGMYGMLEPFMSGAGEYQDPAT